MSIERVYHCDWHECERHVRTVGTHPPTFLTVTEDADDPHHFCSWDCLLRHAAEKPPAQTVPLDDVEAA